MGHNALGRRGCGTYCSTVAHEMASGSHVIHEANVYLVIDRSSEIHDVGNHPVMDEICCGGGAAVLGDYFADF